MQMNIKCLMEPFLLWKQMRCLTESVMWLVCKVQLHQLDPANNMDKFCFMPISLIMYHTEKLPFREALPLILLHWDIPLHYNVLSLKQQKHVSLIKT